MPKTQPRTLCHLRAISARHFPPDARKCPNKQKLSASVQKRNICAILTLLCQTSCSTSPNISDHIENSCRHLIPVLLSGEVYGTLECLKVHEQLTDDVHYTSG